MKIRKMSLISYGPFLSATGIEFSPGINLIVGKNNAGKSFLLKSLLTQFQNQPYRSSELYHAERLQHSAQEIDVEVTGWELEQAGLQRTGEIAIPVPREFSNDSKFYNKFFSLPSIIISASRGANEAFIGREFPSSNWGGHDNIIDSHLIRFGNASITHVRQTQNADSTADLLWHMWSKKLFYFQPQRIAQGVCGYSRQNSLDETASNLAGVLSLMRGEREDLFAKIVTDMREIFDGVKNVSVTNTDQGFEVRIWPTEAMFIAETSSSLSSSGTGLGQALAILVAAATTDQSVLVIDEINTFLHPGAAKTLLRILHSDYGGHQYIVSTHSAEILGSGLANSINLVEKEGEESIVRGMSRDKIEHLTTIGRSLGISASDVFMYQHVVWVEGPTEESCFDLIRRHGDDKNLKAVRFVAVSATGDFFSKKRDRDLVLDVYRKLTLTMSPITPKPLFCFDREGLSEKDIIDIRRRSQYQMHFLTRRNIESFLLDPKAISQLFSRDYPEYVESSNPEYVKDRMVALIILNRYRAISPWTGDLNDPKWVNSVDGASLLGDLFKNLSNNEINYVKTKDSVALLSMILETESKTADELVKTVRELESKSGKL